MDEEEQRKTEQSMGQKIQTTKKRYKQTSSVVRKIRQILAVPILGKIFLILAAFLVIAFVLVGVINFFHSMPNQVRDRLDEIIGLGINWDEIDDSSTNIDQLTPAEDPSNNSEVLVSAAMDLVSKGYNLEGYGFLDTEEGDFVTQDESTGEISEIQSKYLQAYIAANEATYNMAGGASTDFVVRYSEDLIMQIVTEGDPTAWVDKKEYKGFLEIVEEKVSSYLDENYNIPMEDLAQIISESITEFNSSSGGTDASQEEVTQIRSTTTDQILAFMESNLNVEFADGLISFDDSDGVNGVSIDRKNKQLVITVDGLIPSRDGAPATSGTHTYYYNLEGWLTKYARPYEFLLALHLATMAPEFAYEVATSPETNAKVTIGVKQTSVDIDLVVDEEVAAAEGLEKPEVPTVEDLGIAQKGEISALEQCNTDLNFWYQQFADGVRDKARKKAMDYAEKIAKEEAHNIAAQYAEAAAWGWEEDEKGKLHWTRSQDRYNREYDRVHTLVYNALIEGLGDDNASNQNSLYLYLYDRIWNFLNTSFGFAGILTNVMLDVEDRSFTNKWRRYRNFY